MYNFWSVHENWVHLVVKSISLPPRANEKLVLLNRKQNGSAMNRVPINYDDFWFHLFRQSHSKYIPEYI
jgi:hypothetical protein